MQEENSWSNIYEAIIWRMVQTTSALISYFTSYDSQRQFHLFAEAISFLEEQMEKELEDFFSIISKNSEFKNQDLCEKLKIPDDIIPQELICPISLQIIDDIPLYTPYTSKRYSQKALYRWVKEKHTDPITKNPLTFEALNFDYLLASKIEIFTIFLRENFSLLKGMDQQSVKKLTTDFLSRLKQSFDVSTSTDLDDLHDFTQSFIENIKKEAADCQKNSLSIVKTQAHLNLKFQFATCFKQGFFNNQKSTSHCTMSNYVKNNQEYVLQFINRYGNCYTILDLDPYATKNQIEKKFRKLSLKYHPDKNQAQQEEFQKIKEAKDILIDFLKRDFHDHYFDHPLSMHQLS